MVQMDARAPKAEDYAIDLEHGINVSVEDQSKDSVSNGKIQANGLFSKIYSVFVDSRIEGVNSCNESPNLNGIPTMEEKLEEGNKKVVKEKQKKSSNKKSPKPPRPPRGPSLDSADQKLIKEITEIAMLKRARVERMKALKKMKGAKASSSSSSSSSVFAMVFTVLFFLAILFQGMSSSRVTSVNVQGSTSAETPESGLIAVQFGGNPSTGDPNVPNFGPPNYVKLVAGFDPSQHLRTAAQ